MAVFPDDEAGILELARNIVRGLTDHSDIYPSPPLGVLDLGEKIADLEGKKVDIVAIQGNLKEAFDAKDASLEALTDDMKRILRYAENAVDADDTKLSWLGWGARRPPTPLEPPGQTTNLRIEEQGEDSISLDWRKPADGGRAASYRIERRILNEEDWTLVDTVYDTEATLTEQPRGKSLEFRVVATNKAGQGEASNAVAAVL